MRSTHNMRAMQRRGSKFGEDEEHDGQRSLDASRITVTDSTVGGGGPRTLPTASCSG